MAQFDIYQMRHSDQLVLDCQSDLLDHLDTRVVIPLTATNVAPPLKRLHPVFDVGASSYILATQTLTAVDRRDLGQRMGSLADHRYAILDAVDVLWSGV